MDYSREIMRRLEAAQEQLNLATALVKVAAGECDGVSDAGAVCVLSASHTGHHTDAEGTRWLDDA